MGTRPRELDRPGNILAQLTPADRPTPVTLPPRRVAGSNGMYQPTPTHPRPPRGGRRCIAPRFAARQDSRRDAREFLEK